MRLLAIVALLAIAVASGAAPAGAEQVEVKIVKQYGLPYLPLMVMESEKLVEKHAEAAGLGSVKLTLVTVNGAAEAADVLLSNTADIIGSGATALATLWVKTKNTPNEIKGMTALQSMPFYLMSRNPAVKTLKDFSDGDRIALPAVKITIQALVLEMAAAQIFGDANYDRLDRLTVTMTHPQAALALLSGKTEINAHFGVAPYYWEEMADPSIHIVLKSYDVLGGPHMNGVLITTRRFHDGNPKLYAAVIAAQQEANALIKNDPVKAAAIYLQLANDKKNSLETMTKMVSDPDFDYTVVPLKVGMFADFMHRVGRIPAKPDSWKDLFFADIHALPGS
jgi:NitT/TauT family transport system substrate-binding protein